MPDADAVRKAMIGMLMDSTTHKLQHFIGTLFEQIDTIHQVRRVTQGFDEFAAQLGDEKVGIVINADVLRDVEALLFDAMDAVLVALEPDDEQIKEITDDDSLREILRNTTLETRARLADKRAKHLEA